MWLQRRCFLLLLPHLVIACLLVLAASHQESGEWHCDPDDEAQISAQFTPGIVTLDGRADEWSDVDGFEFPLRPALDPDEDNQYRAGKMTVKVIHNLHALILPAISMILMFEQLLRFSW